MPWLKTSEELERVEEPKLTRPLGKLLAEGPHNDGRLSHAPAAELQGPVHADGSSAGADTSRARAQDSPKV